MLMVALIGCFWLLAGVGCCGPMFVSQRKGHGQPEVLTGGNAEPCHCGNVLTHLRHHAFVGPTESDPALLPPHSKFHPVPTRPVFAPREEVVMAGDKAVTAEPDASQTPANIGKELPKKSDSHSAPARRKG